MRRMLITLLLLGSFAQAEPTTQPSLDELRPHYTGPMTIVSARVREANPSQALSHYVYAQPTPYIGWGWGYGYGYGGCYGWGGWLYP